MRRTAGLFSFDHILARGLCALGSDAAGSVDDDLDASDHEPVWATLALCPAEAPSEKADLAAPRSGLGRAHRVQGMVRRDF